jgi:lipopolysaccharide transport system permease protein
MHFVDEEGLLVTVYSPNKRQRGFLSGVRQACDDVYVSRHVIARLFWRDFIAQFRQKIFGYFWALLGPLFGILSFVFLFYIGVLRPGEGEMPYTLYVLVGSTIWGALPGAMGAVSGGLQAQADLIMRTRIPKLALAVSSLAGLFYGIVVSMITMMIIFFAYGAVPTYWFIAYPILVLPMVLLGTSLGLVLSVLGTIARDLPVMATQVLSISMYLTPVIYLRSTVGSPVIRKVIDWNPLTYLVDVPRSLIYTGHAENLEIFLGVFAGILVLVLMSLRIFYQLEDLVAERL